ncbi:hypothetical protein [Stutzerimonas stutzeri]|uniref:COG4648 family protein n=1 Tax=Stutzerimonas stutzeri TaxID=316 RepID=UPI000F71DE25|nr:hypothetical protein [Stutzerimonas stutzeri]VEF17256.1 intracellular septation protein A [Stutzerimonas stutzeri]
MLTRASTIAPGLARTAGLALLLAGLAYPFAVYFGIEHLSPRVFAALLGALWLARLLSSERAASRATAVVALLFCLALALLDDDVLLRWYPVLINAAMLALFAGSLFVGMPVIERLARLQEPDLAEAGVRYTRQVTKVWVGFFVINGTIAAALTLWAPLAWWTLYNGLIAYLLMGLLFAGEWLVRQRVRGRT